jgi:SAM-dependent methyltransferase
MELSVPASTLTTMTGIRKTRGKCSLVAAPAHTVTVGSRLAATIASYDATAADYARRFGGADLQSQMDRFLSITPHGRPILDAGCGPGRDMARLEREVGREVIGLDLSRGLLGVARSQTQAPLTQADVRSLPFRTRTMAGVWSCASLVHLESSDLTVALAEFARVLVDGGAAFVSVRPGTGVEWRSDGHGGARYHVFHSPESLAAALSSCGFGDIDVRIEPGVNGTHWLNALATRKG